MIEYKLDKYISIKSEWPNVNNENLFSYSGNKEIYIFNDKSFWYVNMPPYNNGVNWSTNQINPNGGVWGFDKEVWYKLN